MPEVSVLESFVITSVLFALLPGPNVLFLLARSAQHGPWSAWRSALGVETATALFAVATAAGLGAVVAASSLAFGALRWGGVLYLCWLGVKALKGQPGDAAPAPGPAGESGVREFGAGFTLGVANPKVVLFFLAFLPQFVRSDSPATPQLLALGTAFVVVGLTCDAMWCMLAGIVSKATQSRRPPIVVRRSPAFVYFGLAGWAAMTGHRSR